MRMAELPEPVERLQDAGGRFRMHERQDRRTVLLDRRAQRLERKCLSPLGVEAAHLRPVPRGDLRHTIAEIPRDGDHHHVPRLDRVRDRRLHPGRSRTRNQKRMLVIGLPCITQHLPDIVHDPQEGRVEVADGAPHEGLHHARIGVGRAGAQQQPVRHVESACGQAVGVGDHLELGEVTEQPPRYHGRAASRAGIGPASGVGAAGRSGLSSVRNRQVF